MGQKTSPIGFRTGVTLGWQSTWFAPKANYGDFLVEDQKIREYVDARFNRRMPKGAVAKTEIIRTRNEVNVTLHSGRPGVVIGPRGGEVDKLREELEALTGRKVTVNVVEIKEPDLNATLVGQAIAEQLSKRASFRRTMKQYCESAINAGAKGVKIICSGRLAGSEMARKETQKLGSIPLHTLDADVDYAMATSRTTYGAIGVKVWIYKGKFGEVLERVRPRRRRTPRPRPAGGPPSGGGHRAAAGPRPAADSAPVSSEPASQPAPAVETPPATPPEGENAS
ncbi:MAG: 30S ribosomal protein S3 [Sedimentisphaerales bacterium]|nr:30S ribosomal protein S3 [Sedimentisphaerales bacterium]